MGDFLFECLSEEMPANAQYLAVDRVHKKVDAYLTKSGIDHASLRVLVTPRRLTIIVQGISLDPANSSFNEIKGPKIDAPEEAVMGFLNSYGRTKEDLKVKSVGQKSFFYLESNTVEEGFSPDVKVAEIMTEMTLELLESMEWPKSMRWSTKRVRWVRPIVNLLCIYEGVILPLSFAGLSANDTTVGHRSMYGNVFFEVKGVEDYLTKLEASYVFLDHDMRRLYIKAKVLEVAKFKGLSVDMDLALLNRVSASVEWPVVLMGGIDDRFMSLPAQLLMGVMKNQQDYFAVLDGSGGLAPHFISLSNVESNNVIKGNERVLAARLEDAHFMIQQDLEHNLGYYAGCLAKIVFHGKLGSVQNKVDRGGQLAKYVSAFVPGAASNDKIERLIKLAKADLATAVVSDFPELQGVMGRYYAMQSGEDAEIAQAIEEHYYPLTSSTQCTKNPLAVVLSVADRIDTVVGLIAAGEKLTSSKDPMGIRRTIFGVIRTLIENAVRINIMTVIDKSFATYSQDEAVRMPKDAKFRTELRARLKSLFFDRLKTILKDQGFGPEFIKAIKYEDDVFDYYYRVKLLKNFTSTHLGQSLLQAYRRALNFLQKEERKSGQTLPHNYEAQWLVEKVELDLVCRISALEKDLNLFMKEGRLSDALDLIVTLQVFINDFIDGVVINCDSNQVRENRLKLLAKIRELFAKVADFHHLL